MTLTILELVATFTPAGLTGAAGAPTIPTPPQDDRRARRVSFVLVSVVVLSAVDLAVTLLYMKTVGMYEVNPLVHWLASSANPVLAIAGFKTMTVALSVGVLFGLRRRATAEMGAWLVLGVLICLTVQWARYSLIMDGIGWTTLAQQTAMTKGWVQLS